MTETDKLDLAVQQVVASGASAQVIMEFGTKAERDAAFFRLLNRGAAVRTLDTGGPALLVVSSKASTFATEVAAATQVSIDAKLSAAALTSKTKAARAAAVKARHEKVALTLAPPPPVLSSYSTLSVAIIDSGIAPNPDLPTSRLRAYKDFVTGGTTPVDRCGHGTHVAGIVGGNGLQSAQQYKGLKPDVAIVALRVLGDDCSGKTSDVIAALEWVAQNHLLYRIKVVNLSLGHPVFESAVSDPLVRAVERLSRKGIVVVTAAGNMGVNPATGLPGYGGVGVPCNAPSAVCVGAFDSRGTADLADDKVAAFSSRGPTRFDLISKPDLVASGVNITSLNAPGSTIATGNPGKTVFGSNNLSVTAPAYLTLSGTSMASPAAAGTAARMLTTNPYLSANMVKLLMQYTARLIPGVDTLAQGSGALNVEGAVRLAKIVNARAPIGQSWLTTSRMPSSNVGPQGQIVRWGKRVIYGDRFVLGNAASVHMARWDDNIVWGYEALVDNIVWGNQADDNIVWGNQTDDNIVWGNIADDDNVVWGNLSSLDNIVWGNLSTDNIVWGENIVWGFDNIVWGYWADNIVWGFWADNIVWGNVSRGNFDNIVWGNKWDNIVWGNCSRASSALDNIVWGVCASSGSSAASGQ